MIAGIEFCIQRIEFWKRCICHTSNTSPWIQQRNTSKCEEDNQDDHCSALSQVVIIYSSLYGALCSLSSHYYAVCYLFISAPVQLHMNAYIHMYHHCLHIWKQSFHYADAWKSCANPILVAAIPGCLNATTCKSDEIYSYIIYNYQVYVVKGPLKSSLQASRQFL